jgi:hypothetical protein
MRFRIMLCVTGLAVGCAPAEEQPGAETAAATISLADFAGTWTVSTMPEASDSVLVTYELAATATTDGWTLTFPGRDPIPVTVALVDGDSVVTDMGPFESALRPGVMVTTRAVSRPQGDMLSGTFVAHYATDTPDSVLRGRLHGTRKTQ